VFQTARTLIGIIRREVGDSAFASDKARAEVAVIAALLHDVGHGPFSHTFERIHPRKHELWTADIIRDPNGNVKPLLDSYATDFADAVASLLAAEDPTDIYHAVVSSSFDADRLDYLRRDRLMTGTGAGAIDFDWLMENLRVREISIEAADSGAPDETMQVPTFCLDAKALPAAEQFLLARYTLHEQVYFHKTTRCVESMIGQLLRTVATEAKSPEMAPARTGLPAGHPLLRFFATATPGVADYLALDDGVITAAFALMQAAGSKEIATLATRLRNRDLYKAVDIPFGEDGGRQTRRIRHLDQDFKAELDSGLVIKDTGAAINIYTQIGGDDDRVHKKLHVIDQDDRPKEITKLSKLIGALGSDKRAFIRYYFANTADRDRAIPRKGGTK
jgi:HD superfamily phosphohydrolase